MSRPPDNPSTPANNVPPQRPKVRCAGCGGLLDNYIVAQARFAPQDSDILVSHLSVAHECVDVYRELGRVEWLFADDPLASPVSPTWNMRIESGLSLAVFGTVGASARLCKNKQRWRVRFVDARKGGERWLPGVFGKRADAEEYLEKARARGIEEMKLRGVKDWRIPSGE